MRERELARKLAGGCPPLVKAKPPAVNGEASKPEPDKPPDTAIPDRPGTAFEAFLEDLLAEVCRRCREQTGDEYEYVARGVRYRWRLLQSDNPENPFVEVVRYLGSTKILSAVVKVSDTFEEIDGPSLFREAHKAVVAEARARMSERAVVEGNGRKAYHMTAADFDVVAGGIRIAIGATLALNDGSGHNQPALRRLVDLCRKLEGFGVEIFESKEGKAILAMADELTKEKQP